MCHYCRSIIVLQVLTSNAPIMDKTWNIESESKTVYCIVYCSLVFSVQSRHWKWKKYKQIKYRYLQVTPCKYQTSVIISLLCVSSFNEHLVSVRHRLVFFTLIGYPGTTWREFARKVKFFILERQGCAIFRLTRESTTKHQVALTCWL